MKTYSQMEKAGKFNWHTALSVDFEKMSISKMETMRDKAMSWVTCACGNQCAIIPRNAGGEPLDRALSDLGCEFTKNIDGMRSEMYSAVGSAAVGNRKRLNAVKILDRIEKRSAKLILKEQSRLAKDKLKNK